jgi:hypothetical protein
MYTMFKHDGFFRVYRPNGEEVFRVAARHWKFAQQLVENLNDPDYEAGE